MGQTQISTLGPKVPMLSVGELTACLRKSIENNPTLRQVWVTGEISSIHEHPSGTFLTLQDTQTRAILKGVIWQRQRSQLSVPPRLGEEIAALGQVTLYAHGSNYQLRIWRVIPVGAGLQALTLHQCRERLQREGLFDRSRPLPSYPQRIAVITSPQAAAWGDIQQTLTKRSPGLRVLFAPAIVQGDAAPASIQSAFQQIEHHGGAELVILARGGGATEDFNCFNDERVVRAIAACPIPVITGIGHQRDQTLADAAADSIAHTPTAAAERAVPPLSDLYRNHQIRQGTVLERVQAALSHAQNRTQSLEQRLRRLKLARQWNHEQRHLNDLQHRLVRAVKIRLQIAQQQTHALKQTLISLDPEAVLRRGYALVRQQNGTLATAPQALQIGERISIHWGQGQVQATVTHISREPPC